MGPGCLIAMGAAGCGRTAAGIGTPIIRGVGRRSIMAVGAAIRVTVGFGARIESGGRLGSAGATRQPTAVGLRCRLALALPLESVGPATGRAWEQTPVSASRRLLSPLFPSTTLLTGICPITAWTRARPIPFSALRQ